MNAHSLRSKLVFRLTFPAVLVLASLACGLSAPLAAPALSAPTGTPNLLLTPTPLPTSQPAILESRTLTLEWPSVIRAGDADLIRLTLELDEKGNLTPTAEYAGHVTSEQMVYIPNVYDTHNVVAEARLDLAEVQVVPAGMSSQPLRPGQSVIFYWSVRPAEAGNYRGVVWFLVRFVPKTGGPESERAVAAFPVEIKAVALLGLKADPARILGVVGMVVSSVLGVPFLEDIVRWAWKRIMRT